MKALGAKILAVMSEVGKVGKDKTNSFHKYAYASDEAVVGEIRGALIKNRLAVIPNQKECTTTSGTNRQGEASFLTSLAVEYTLLDVDSGESMVATAYGQGVDSGDKGVYKAATGAEKYFLLKTFLIATGDDAEKESPQRSSQAQTPRKSAPEPLPDPVADAHSNAPAAEAGGGDFITDCFHVSDPIKSKKGTFFRKAMGRDQKSYFVWEDEVIRALQVANGGLVTVELETENGFTKIKQVMP